METLLGIDLGTTGIKAALCSPQGQALGESYLEYPLIKPAPGVVEQDADQWWALTQDAIRQAIRAAGVSGQAVRALGVSSQGISFVPVDEGGQALCHAINWLDSRATAEAGIILQRYSEADLFRLTGKRASPMYVLPKLLWLRAHRPDTYRRAHKFLMGHDFLLHRFTGQAVTDHSMAGGTLLYDISRLGWSQEMLAAFEIDAGQLPEVRWSGTSLGPIRPEVAAALDLSPGAVVAVGGQDQKCAALGASIRPGVATVSLGTASAISCLTDQPLRDPARRIPIFPFVAPGYWDLEGVVGTAGGAFRWLRETLFPGETYAALDARAAASPPGANGVCFFPHLSGTGSPHWRADVWGALTGLSLASAPGDVVRAVLEGVAFQIRANLEVMAGMGIAVEELVLFGGGAKSPLWGQMISDISGKPATASKMIDVANWGACLLAGAAAGLCQGDLLEPSMGGEGASRWLPRPEIAARYSQVYRHYQAQESKLLS
ncbi:MAG: xylulokinase [Chloroflexota bacterium]